MRYGEETIEQIRQAVGLVELIGALVALRKVGQTWKGLCPFHNEKTPSFTVNPDRQAYHCFGCGAGGDCFRFVMETEKLSFVEAVQALAERFGVALPAPAEEEQHGRIYAALEGAAMFYRRTLEDPETGRVARAYLAARGLTPESLEAYGVGLAPAGSRSESIGASARSGRPSWSVTTPVSVAIVSRPLAASHRTASRRRNARRRAAASSRARAASSKRSVRARVSTSVASGSRRSSAAPLSPRRILVTAASVSPSSRGAAVRIASRTDRASPVEGKGPT